MLRTFKKVMDNLITDALSRWSISSFLSGNAAASSVKISVSLERRQRAASLDFSFRFSLFLKLDKNEMINMKSWKEARANFVVSHNVQQLHFNVVRYNKVNFQ